MSFDLLGDLNWLAVVVAALAYFMLGAAWYAPPLFGKAWMASIGWDPGEQPPQMNPMSYVAPFLAYLVAAVAIGMLAVATTTDTVGEGVVLGLVLGVGFAGTIVAVTAVFDPKSPKPSTWAVITGGYHLVGILIASIILALWT